MPTIMQAAERLRRLKAGETPMAVYQDGVEEIVFVTLERNADWMTLADFALSILPKGERPVAIDRSYLKHGDNPGWVVDEECYYSIDCVCPYCLHPDVSPVFSTKEEADREAHWNQLQNILNSDRNLVD
jgi:hypothetical protein